MDGVIINNKYYIDDVQESVREIDIIAYKATKQSQIQFFTALIISCKKSSENIWALLSSERRNDDPNILWRPQHYWTNDKALGYMLEKTEWKDSYFASGRSSGVADFIHEPDVHIFAFQEMNRSSGSPQNDKAIFTSVTALMKAQGYELKSLLTRKREPCFYDFNLLSIADTDLIRLHFSDTGISASPLDHDIYIGRYIINRKETQARVHFIQIGTLQKAIGYYDALHKQNVKFYHQLHEKFYDEYLLKEPGPLGVLEKDLYQEIRSSLWTSQVIWGGKRTGVNSVSVQWSEKDKLLEVQVDASVDEIDFFNQDQQLNKTVAMQLKKIYRYSGTFVFASLIPF